MKNFFTASHKRSFLFHEAFASFGEGMIGIFFPFLLMKAFDLSVSGVLYSMGIIFGVFALLVLPVHVIFRRFGPRFFLFLGTLSVVLFYSFLAFDPNAWWSVYVGMGLYTLGHIFYWPAYNWTITHTTKDGNRGGFLAWVQILNVAMGMVAPVVTGYFFSINQEQWIVYIALVFFLLGLWVLLYLPTRSWEIPDTSQTVRVLKDHFFSRSSFKGHFVDAFQGRMLWIPWPLFLSLSLPGYIALGGVKALSAFSEIITSRFSGKWMDNHSSTEVLSVGLWARFFDIGSRSLLLFFPFVWFAGAINILAGILGPFFNVPFWGRVIERSENMPEEDMVAFYIAREWFLGFWSVILFFASGWLYTLFGSVVFAILLFFAAVSSFLVRDF